MKRETKSTDEIWKMKFQNNNNHSKKCGEFPEFVCVFFYFVSFLNKPATTEQQKIQNALHWPYILYDVLAQFTFMSNIKIYFITVEFGHFSKC